MQDRTAHDWGQDKVIPRVVNLDRLTVDSVWPKICKAAQDDLRGLVVALSDSKLKSSIFAFFNWCVEVSEDGSGVIVAALRVAATLKCDLLKLSGKHADLIKERFRADAGLASVKCVKREDGESGHAYLSRCRTLDTSSQGLGL